MRIGNLSSDGRYQILVNDGYYILVVIAFVEIFSKICIVKNHDSVRLS